jgi:hypothetical protein
MRNSDYITSENEKENFVGSRAAVVMQYQTPSALPVSLVRHDVEGSPKGSGEFTLPIAQRFSERPDARHFLTAMPQLPCRVLGMRVGGQNFDLVDLGIEPFDVDIGCRIRAPIPSSVGSLAADLPAAFHVLVPTFRGSGKMPISARIAPERVPTSIVMPAHSTVAVQWAVEAPCKFKRMRLEVIGDAKGLFLLDLRVGKDSWFLSSDPIGFDVFGAEDAFNIPDVMIPGIIFTLFFSNDSNEELVLGGGVVFEDVSREVAEAVEREREKLKSAEGAGASPGAVVEKA